VAFRNRAIPFGVLTFQVVETGDRTVLLSELWNVPPAERGFLRKLWDQDCSAAFPASPGASCLLCYDTNPGARVHGSLQSRDRCLAGDYSTPRRRTVRDIFGTPFLTHGLSLLTGQPAERSERPATQYSNSSTALHRNMEFLRRTLWLGL
jgi:hypothetical protein